MTFTTANDKPLSFDQSYATKMLILGKYSFWYGNYVLRGEVRELEQSLLRAAGGHQAEYVWSDVLKAHVRIGESLKLKARATGATT